MPIDISIVWVQLPTFATQIFEFKKVLNEVAIEDYPLSKEFMRVLYYVYIVVNAYWRDGLLGIYVRFKYSTRL